MCVLLGNVLGCAPVGLKYLNNILFTLVFLKNCNNLFAYLFGSFIGP